MGLPTPNPPSPKATFGKQNFGLYCSIIHFKRFLSEHEPSGMEPSETHPMFLASHWPIKPEAVLVPGFQVAEVTQFFLRAKSHDPKFFYSHQEQMWCNLITLVNYHLLLQSCGKGSEVPLLNYVLHTSAFFSDFFLVYFFRIPNISKVLLFWAVRSGDG